MRLWLASVLRLAPLFVVPTPTRGHETAAQQQEKAIRVLAYDEEAAYVSFALAHSGCSSATPNADADDDLVLDLRVNPTTDLWTSNVFINDQKLDIVWKNNSTTSSQLLTIPNSPGHSDHSILVEWYSVNFDSQSFFQRELGPTQELHFYVTLKGCTGSIKPCQSFLAVMSPTSERRLVGLRPDELYSPFIDFQEPGLYRPEERFSNSVEKNASAGQDSQEDDLEDELASLALLESQAHQLQAHIAAKKKAIAYGLKQERDKLRLKQLIKDCDGVFCAAKAIAQRLCDRVGIAAPASFGYAQMRHAQAQHQAALVSHKAEQKQGRPGIEASHSGSTTTTKHPTAYAFHATSLELTRSPNYLVRVLQGILAFLGIAALINFIRRKCASVRTRAERAADREERRNARAYRRAARRALMRKRWDNFISSINCFRSREEPRIDDYEEKRALILQDAFLEQDLDQAEKGEVMEAEIRELRYAHEIVSSMVRVDENRYDLVPPLHDPPPPLVPLPYTPGTRSRANSTYTLPSYHSESLPDYSSQPADSENSSRVGNHDDTPPTSTDGERVPPASESSRSTKYTPTSSVREMSPRPSQETLRTRLSRDAQDR